MTGRLVDGHVVEHVGLLAADGLAIEEQINRAAEVGIRDVAERQTPETRLADLPAAGVTEQVEPVGGDEVELGGIQRIPRAVLGTREDRGSRGAQRESHAIGNVRRARRGVHDFRRVAGDENMLQRAIGQAGLVHFGAQVGLGADIHGQGVGHDARAAVVVADHERRVLREGIRERIFPAADADEAGAVRGEVELSEDVALAGVRAGHDGALLPAGRTAFLAVHEDALLRAEAAPCVVEGAHLREVSRAKTIEGDGARGRIRLLRAGVPAVHLLHQVFTGKHGEVALGDDPLRDIGTLRAVVAHRADGIAHLMVHQHGEGAVAVVECACAVRQAVESVGAAADFGHEIVCDDTGIIHGEDRDGLVAREGGQEIWSREGARSGYLGEGAAREEQADRKGEDGVGCFHGAPLHEGQPDHGEAPGCETPAPNVTDRCRLRQNADRQVTARYGRRKSTAPPRQNTSPIPVQPAARGA